jgi:ABC-type transport system substrate-binding protein
VTVSDSRARRRLIALFGAVTLVAAACAPSPTGSPSLSSTPTQAARATPVFADTIRIAVTAGPLSPLSNASTGLPPAFNKATLISTFIHEALYRYDQHLTPVPSLARSCDPSSDGLTITCGLIEANFQNGDPVTADDVVFTYRLMSANTHVGDYAPPCVTTLVTVGPTFCLWEILDSTTKVDEHTVAFHLKRPYAPFFTLVLPAIWIDSQKVVRAAFDAYRAQVAGFAAKDLDAEAAKLTREAEAPAGKCEPLLQDVAQTAARAGLFVPVRAEYENDACGYATALSLELAQAAASLGAPDEITAIALVYPDLSFDRAPTGAGPYKLTAYEPNKQVALEAWAGWHGGAPATKHIVFEIYPDDYTAAKAVAHGEADWVESTTASVSFDQLVNFPSVVTGHSPVPGFDLMVYNVRPGELFSDLRLRQALNLCLDKPAIAAAGTDGQTVAAYADVSPGSWAYDAQLPKPARDVASAKALIEASGWTMGSDGVYAKAGKPLAAKIYVRTNFAYRVKLAAILSGEARDCGMDLAPVQIDFQAGLESIMTWPNHGPDTTQPFDLFLFGWILTWDPLNDIFASGQITTKARPVGDNPGGFSNPRVDALLGRLETTYDVQARADLSRQYQEIIAEQQPALFVDHWRQLDAAAKGLRTTDGPLDLNMPYVWAFPERVVLEISSGS